LNCALGAKELRQYVEEMSGVAQTHVSCYPNAGLPNAFGEYDDTPESMARHIGEWARAGLLNLAGGCCGTTPAHIAAIAAALRDVAPRAIPERPKMLRLSGLEPLNVGPESLVRQCRRANQRDRVAAFARLVLAGNYAEALTVARQQVETAPRSSTSTWTRRCSTRKKAMTTFLNLAASEPDISRVPVMVDSSRWSVIEAGSNACRARASSIR
jgi:5-methyltetrahydrofolate--homocysteine methyltransferase